MTNKRKPDHQIAKYTKIFNTMTWQFYPENIAVSTLRIIELISQRFARERHRVSHFKIGCHRNFFKHSDFCFIQQNLKFCRFFLVFFTHKMIKNVLCNKSKNSCVRFFMCMSSMCVQLFTAFEEAVLKLYVPW